MQQLGHRKRSRERYQKVPLRSVEDYELLEILLYHCLPRADTKVIARSLLGHFGSLHAVLNAEEIDLLTIKGVGPGVVFFLKLLQDLYGRIMLPIKAKNVVLNHWSSVVAYCRMSMAFHKEEQFRVLYLNKRYHLIGEEIMAHGSIDEVAVYPRTIAKRAVAKGAMAVIIAHNHPSNDLKPSRADIEMTKNIKGALATLEIELIDHLLITNYDCFSFKSNMLL